MRTRRYCAVDLSAGALFSSLVVSSIGLALFLYGKREQRWPQLVGGMLLMGGPYFTGGALGTVAFGAVVGIAIWLAARAGL